MTRIEDLKQGMEFYSISSSYFILHYTYLCVHPTGGKSYHILIDENTQDPLRMHYTELNILLNKNIKTFAEAKIALIEKIQKHVELLKSLEK